MQISGKLVILGIIGVALAGAGAGWWFRYNATHRAAEFWGPQAVRLIRDAPIVELFEYGRLPNDEYQKLINGRDISNAPGLVHLRNALLEDRSFRWPAKYEATGALGWALIFRNQRGDTATLNFTSDWRNVYSVDQEYILACEPISSGLARFVDELPTPAGESRR